MLVVQEPSNDLLNILRRVVMAGVDQTPAPADRLRGRRERHPPIGNIRVVEGRFERFVFDQQPLLRIQAAVDFLERLFEPHNALADALCPRIVGAVREPSEMSRHFIAFAIATHSSM